MGVEFFEEEKRNIPTAAQPQARGATDSLRDLGHVNVSGSQALLLCVGLLSLFGAYLIFSLTSDANAKPPTQAEIHAMADLLKKQR